MMMKDMLLGWARDAGAADEICETWSAELKTLGVRSLHVLEKLARGDRWERFLDKLNSDVLVEYLRDWKGDDEKSLKRPFEIESVSEDLENKSKMMKLDYFPLNAIDLNSQNNLSRDDLVDRLWDLMTRNMFVVISSPPATGKTSLLQLLGQKYHISEYLRCGEDSDPFSMLSSVGIDLIKREFLPKEKVLVLAIDDAQNIYERKDFWGSLLKEGPV
jgi:hypothetical protein